MTQTSNESLDLEYLEIYAYADLAAGKDAKSRTKIGRARQAIVVGARDWLDRWFFIHIWAGRYTTSKFKDKILEVQEVYKPRLFGFEANGMQVLFGNTVRDEAKLRFGGAVKMIPIYQPTNVVKEYRIRTGIEPPILQGRLFLLDESIEAWTELTGFPTAATKDIVDAMETCISRVAPRRPIGHKKDGEKAALAKYLRSVGTPAHIIESRIREFKPTHGLRRN